MRKIILLCFSFILAIAAELSIATFNVENLFDAKNNGTEYQDFVIGKSQWNEKTAKVKFGNIKNIIKELNADIIALQEIENEEILKELMRATGYQYFAFSKDKRSPIGLGLISKIRPIETKIFKVPNVKTRDIVKVKFELDGHEFSLFVNHMPAQKNSLKSRESAFRSLKSAIQNDENVILLGDFNTPYGKESLLNDILISRNMVDLWQFMASDKRYSHINLRPIDHAVVSKQMVDGSGISYVNGSFEVYKQGKNVYSDHFPLKFKISTATKAKIQEKNIDDIFKNPKNTPFVISGVTVVYKDKKGFVIAKDGRGIYVYEPKNDDLVGSVMDVVINDVGEYKGMLEVKSLYVSKIYDKLMDPKLQMLGEERINEARAGDVIRSVSGEIKRGRLYTKYGDIRIYSSKGKMEDVKKAKFEAVKVVLYHNEPQIWIEK
ncbi:endonuclease/exonuclease/phosphatase family protein [Campylobacter sp. RM16192]|uniref:endonuclease/exonuclease/phosphatase family protein n=1 Tax=Campylobacter sp. RM16192 TaxID=1660080 RepID=UPI0014526953|nr:endonuclease/exonuclease/phosphatase family protein [Campylobacter sp. RM16192]QCD52769.1 endonuclease/exonuclease/phosphatase [Campylobacter sp. RM16192]